MAAGRSTIVIRNAWRLEFWRARQESNLYRAQLAPNSATLGAKSQQDTVTQTN